MKCSWGHTCSSCSWCIRTALPALGNSNSPPVANGAVNAFSTAHETERDGVMEHTVMLSNLVAGGKIGVEVMLSIER